MSASEFMRKGKITIYRVVPKGEKINAGDFVFDTKSSAEKYLKEYGVNRGATEIQTIKNVGLDELLLTDNPNYLDRFEALKRSRGEFIYAPKELQNTVKTKSQLTDIVKQRWEKANKTPEVVSKELNPLAQAEEFVKAQTTQNWSKLQKENPDLFNTGILRKSQAPYKAVGEIPKDVHSMQGKWQNYGQDAEIPADKVYNRIDKYGDYVDENDLPIRNQKTGDNLQSNKEWDDYAGKVERTTISNQQLKDEFIKSFSTPEGKKYLNEVVKALPKNPDGSITAYRIGSIGGEGAQSYTLSEGMAKTFSNQGTDILPAGTPGLPTGGYKDFGALPVNTVKIDPKGIVAWSPYDAEILVEPKFVKTKSQLTDFNAQKYADEMTDITEKAKKSIKKISPLRTFYREVKSKIVDFASPIEDTLRRAQKESKFKIAPKSDITYQIDRTLRAPTIGGQFAKDNGLVNVIRKTDNLHNLDQYLIAKHAKTVSEQGFKTGRDLNKDQQLIEAFAPKYEQQAQVVNKYSQKLLDYITDAGLISKELNQTLKIKYPHYVPLNRVFNELEKGTLSKYNKKAIASLGKQTIVQKLKGSERAIESPIESLLVKTNDAFIQGEKNKAARILASYKDLPNNPFQLTEVKQGENAPHTISFLDNGTKRTFSAPKEIAVAAKALDVQQMNILGKMFALPTRVARLGITGINLPFVAANIARDQVTAIINSRNPLRTSLANPVNFVSALFNAVGHGKLYQEMVRMGGGGTSFDIARTQAPKTIKEIRAGRNIFTKIAYTVRHPAQLLRTVENIVGRSEELTRLQQYRGTKQAALAKGMSLEEAQIEGAKAAQTSTVNFARRGEWGTVLNSAWLYLNANIQGTRTLVRNLRERPLQTGTKIATTVLLPVATVTLWNLADEKRRAAYQDIAEYEKENNLIIVPPDPQKDEQNRWNIIKIPFSQEISNLTNLVRRPLEQAAGFDPVKTSEVLKSLIGTVLPVNKTSLIPQALTPSIEAYANKNFFTGAPQVSQSLSKLSPELQVKPNTSGTTRLLGRMIKQSPIKIEEFAKGTFGGITPQFLNLSDRALAALGKIPREQIGGETVWQGIIRRFKAARGGAIEQKEAENIKGILQKQADVRYQTKQKAEDVYAELKKLPREEAAKRFDVIATDDPILAQKIRDTVEEEKQGLTYEDRLVRQLGVENGERARYLFKKFNSLKTKEEKAKLWNEYTQKKIISDKVRDQLLYLLNH